MTAGPIGGPLASLSGKHVGQRAARPIPERRPAKFGEREAILNKFGQGEFHAYSAVSQPKGQVNRTQSSCCRGSATRP